MVQIKNRAFFRAIDNLRKSIGNTTRADIVNRQNRIGRAELPAVVNHLLRTALNLWIAALHRIKVQIRSVRAGTHRRSRTATQTDFHAWTTELNQQSTFRQIFFAHVLRIDIAHTARYHNRLVITIHLRTIHPANRLLKGAEVARQIRATKFIVKRRATNRTFEHDVQRRSNSFRFAITNFPRTRCIGQM